MLRSERRRGWWLVTLYGQVALAAYLLGGPWKGLLLELGVAAALTVCLAVWCRSKAKLDDRLLI